MPTISIYVDDETYTDFKNNIKNEQQKEIKAELKKLLIYNTKKALSDNRRAGE